MKRFLLLQAVLMFPLQEMRRGTRAVMFRRLHRTALVIMACLVGLAVIPEGNGEAARDPLSPACLEYSHEKSRSDTRTAWRLYQGCARFLAAGIKKGVAANDQWDVQALLDWARALQACGKTDDPLLCAAKLDRVAALKLEEPHRAAPTPQAPKTARPRAQSLAEVSPSMPYRRKQDDGHPTVPLVDRLPRSRTTFLRAGPGTRGPACAGSRRDILFFVSPGHVPGLRLPQTSH